MEFEFLYINSSMFVIQVNNEELINIANKIKHDIIILLKHECLILNVIIQIIQEFEQIDKYKENDNLLNNFVMQQKFVEIQINNELEIIE